MKADQTTEAEVKAVLQNFTKSYERRDLSGLLACFPSDQDVVLYGTGKDEKRIGTDQIRVQAERDWSQTDSAAIDFSWISVSTSGSVAWAAADGEIRIRVGNQELSLLLRTTFVLVKQAGTWLIVQSHFSLPNAGQDEGESF